MSSLKRSFWYLKPYYKEAAGAIILLALVVAANLSIPRLVQVIIDEGVAERDLDVIMRTSLLMIAASILSALFMTGNTILARALGRSLQSAWIVFGLSEIGIPTVSLYASM